jgi:regulator of protease activity HflC (stomatin/prohibitin superfamily)
MHLPGISDPTSQRSDYKRDPYRGVVIVLLAASLLGTAGAVAGGLALANPVLLDAAITLGLSTGVLIGVALAQTSDGRASGPPPPGEPATPALSQVTPSTRGAAVSPRRTRVLLWIGHWSRDFRTMRHVRVGTAAAGLLVTCLLLVLNLPAAAIPQAPLVAAIAAALCLGGAGLTAIAVRYLVDIDPVRLPEAPGLCRGARIVAWILVLAAAAMGLAWAGQQTLLRILHVVVLTINAAVCYGLLAVKRREEAVPEIFPLDLGVLTILGSRTNIFASVLDAAERQLGIDLRSTWALTVVRRSLEPLIIGLCLVGWLSTSLTVVGVEQQGLVERLGVPLGGQPLPPGLHLHWPWPVDHVFRIPVRRVQILAVGHEARTGPENVLWAVEHAAQEYNLLLGDGRDLITIDAAVQFRIADAGAWRYHCQNPGDALRAIAYRAVMRSTVNRTLADALSENVVTMTGRMRAMVQQDADALGLGVEVVGFTVGAMHPPVLVASDYQAVVSAELRKVTAAVNAQALRNRMVPAAETSVLVSENSARAEGANALAVAAGEAWSFLTLESQYRVAPLEYFFRRRLETLEKGLAGRRFTVVDTRFQRDGGELWVMP